MRICTGRTALAALIGVFLCYGPVTASAQTVPDRDLIEVLAGVLYTLEKADSDYEDGKNLDGSLRWDYIEGEDTSVLAMTFSSFRYYVVQEGSAGGRIITLSGAMEMDTEEDLLSGTLTVRGVPSVFSLDMAGFDMEKGSVKVNGRLYDNKIMERLFDSAYEIVDDSAVISMETEAGLVFLSVLMSLEVIRLNQELRDADFDGGNFPGGIAVSNEEGTVSLLTQNGAINLSYAAYSARNMPREGILPILDGKISIMFQLSRENIQLIVFDGSLQVKNQSFVSSMRLDSCAMVDLSKKGASGSITINGTPYWFGDFIGILGQMPF
jgi:hypothetical protein